ncbi:MAG: LytTR family DNA-binding domain-containing protein [Pseudomonadota bacterium]
MTVTGVSRREFLLAEIGIVALIGCAFALANVFNPSGMALGGRMAFWIGGMLAAWIVFGLVGQVGKAVARLLGIAGVWGYVIAIPLATVFISWTLLWWLGGTRAMFGPGFAYVWPQTLAIAVAFFAVFFILYSRVEPREDVASAVAHKADTSSQCSPLHEHLSPGFPSVIALSVEDHYVHVHSQEKSEMLLIPLAKAIKLLANEDGRQVHRSWWVARSALQGHKRAGRDIKLKLAGGLEVPVSRSLVKSLREDGWFI